MRPSDLDIIASPCQGSGYCCKKAPCPLSIDLYPVSPEYAKPYEDRDPSKLCPALYHDGGQFRCRHAKEYANELHIGAGCCSPLNSERK